MFYFAYGMNTNRLEMSVRCPAALSLGPATLLNHRFRFATHADVVKDTRYDTQGVLWEITDNCLASLDTLEGYPYYYDRSEQLVLWEGHKFPALVYHMQPGNPDAGPNLNYLNCVLEGYREHGVDVHQIYRTNRHLELN